MLIFWSLVRNSVVLAVYLLFSVACFLTVHEHLRTGYYEEAASERQMHRLTGHSGRASVHMSEMSKQSIVAGVSALC